MSAKCEVCGKAPSSGSSIKRRGKAKYLGGVGRKITGITKRWFSVNLQRVRIQLPDGTRAQVRVCAQCIRSGAVTKRSRRVVPAPKTE